MIDYDYDKLAKMDFFKVKRKHKSMPMSERASIFRPFDALDGYKEELKKAEKRQRDKYRHEDKYYKHSN